MPTHDFVLDASVLVAGIRTGEPFYDEAGTVLETLTRRRANLYIPAIALAEVGELLANWPNA